ncbi:MAG: hypothetical protein K8R36_00225 [Planctomycetales bacterium]|nr:hypothetical protein [Planctomycetales bacterium]
MSRKQVVQFIAVILMMPAGMAVQYGMNEKTWLTAPMIATALLVFMVACGALLWSERRWPA